MSDTRATTTAAPSSPPAAVNPPPAPAAPGTIPGFDKISFAQRRLAQDKLSGKVR